MKPFRAFVLDDEVISNEIAKNLLYNGLCAVAQDIPSGKRHWKT
jgi:hypothetical protein